jgi:hypothetical protein
MVVVALAFFVAALQARAVEVAALLDWSAPNRSMVTL